MTAPSVAPPSQRPGPLRRALERAQDWRAARHRARWRKRTWEAAAGDAPVARKGVRGAWRRMRRATDRYRLLTDVIGAIVIVGVLVGGLAIATGGVWPPVVVIESGSMMHSSYETPYGRWGTIDVGDMVFIRAVDPDEIRTWADGGEVRYGRPGAVIAFAQNGDHANTSIIHRAIARVDVERGAFGQATYRLHWVDGEVLTFGPEGIYFPPLGFSEELGFTRTNGYKPAYSGFLTKGDNAFSNPATDQALNISRMVEPTWIIGEVYGEVPWIGLGKLALQSGKTNPSVAGWERIGNAFAPLELWSMFFLVLAIVILVPFSIDTYRAWRRHRERVRDRERLLQETARPKARPPPPPPPPPRPAPTAPKRVSTFQVVTRPAPTQPGRDP